MCGRFALSALPEEVLEYLALLELEDFPPRYNIAPTQPILVVTGTEPANQGSNRPERRALLVRWGLLPGWVKETAGFPLLFNARAESAAEKAAFRAAMRHRRVLVPASGFYEWRKGAGQGGHGQAFWVRPRRGGLIAFGGLMETYASADGSEIDTGAILTVRANGALSRIHERMPVVVRPEDFSRWLDCRNQEPRDVTDLLAPVEDDFFEAVPVSDAVNKVANENAALQERVAEVPEQPTQKAAPRPNDQLSLF